MSDLLVPSTILARKADTGENVKLEAKEIRNARIRDVPNYTADLFKMASAASKLWVVINAWTLYFLQAFETFVVPEPMTYGFKFFS